MIIVFGSINQDMFFDTAHLPVAGETCICPAYEVSGGGKGANQALAACRSGAKTALVSRIGNDGMGLRMTTALRREGVMTSGVAHSDLPTGCAMIARDVNGENQVLVAMGANADVTNDQVPDDILGPRNMILMQMEIRPEQNWALIDRAKKIGAQTILNLAPAIHIPDDIMKKLDYLVVNQIEARQIADKLGIPVDKNALMIAKTLAANGGLTCIVTLGPEGSFAVTKDGRSITVNAMKLADKVIDTTGSGDAYCGTLAAALHAGLSLDQAMRRASVAGSLTCLGKGAQSSFPYLAAIDEHLSAVGEAKMGKI